MGLLSEIFKSFFHPKEIQAMFQVKFGGLIPKEYNEPLDELAATLSDLDFSYAVLNKVSRSFAVVIQQLPEELKDPVCVFYLVLRGLDSIEDDMTFPQQDKLPLLRSFHDKLDIKGWKINDVGDTADYRILLAHFDKVINVYQDLGVKYQAAIKDICHRMGDGMADFQEQKVTTMEGYNLYCHYVAGLVGYGLSDLFSASGLEDASLRHEHKLSNSMGVFLQKTNIIRDYLEDMEGGRSFWPQEVWGKYADQLSDFARDPHNPKALACLNEYVTDALEHIPDCLEYLGRIKNPQIFRFCAIPQVMAIATLAALYNNPSVFKRVVKIRKGLSCKLMVDTNDMAVVHDVFRKFVMDIGHRIPAHDPNADRTYDLVEKVKASTQLPLPRTFLKISSLLAFIILTVVIVYTMQRYRERHHIASGTSALHTQDFAALLAGFLSIGYLFGFFGMQYV